jgi:hypothetical protein
MAGPRVKQDFRYHKGKFRAGSLLPFSAEKLPELWGFPPNLAHGDAPYDSLIPHVAAVNADGQVYAMTGARLAGALVIAAGHKHDDAETQLDWIKIASLPLRADRLNNPEAASVVSSDPESRFALTHTRVPDGATAFYARTKVTAPVGVGVADAFYVIADFYGDNDVTLASPISALFYYDLRNGKTHTEEWLEAGPISIAGLSFLGAEKLIVGRWRWFFQNVVSGLPEAAIWEVQLGLREGQ